MSATFTARHRTRCLTCDEDIRPGDEAAWDDGLVVHAACLGDERVERVAAICPICHLTKPCDCEDER